MRTSTPRFPRFRAPWPLLVLAAATSLSLAPRTAAAQLGKLKKLGADAIKDAAKDKLGTDKKPTPATAGGAAAAATGAKAANNGPSLPKLDDDRIALVLASLAPQVRQAEIKANAAPLVAPYEQKKQASKMCLENAAKTLNPMTMAASAQKNEARLTALQKQIEAVQTRYGVASQANDVRKQVFLEDSLSVLSSRQGALSYGFPCTFEFTPVALLEAWAIDRQGRMSGDNGQFDPGAAARELITRTEYGVIRERIALWALLQENPTLKGLGKEGVFSPEEQAALAKNAVEIRKLAPLFKSDAMMWKGWNDLRDW